MAFARLLFPSEAKLAMDIANAETTSQYPGLMASRGSSGNLREVDLNETPIAKNERILARMAALKKTGMCRGKSKIAYKIFCTVVVEFHVLDFPSS